jgi:hypothetical protein
MLSICCIDMLSNGKKDDFVPQQIMLARENTMSGQFFMRKNVYI